MGSYGAESQFGLFSYKKGHKKGRVRGSHDQPQLLANGGRGPVSAAHTWVRPCLSDRHAVDSNLLERQLLLAGRVDNNDSLVQRFQPFLDPLVNVVILIC